MELKPYIEEPLSVVAVSKLISLDLRPRIRHDFVLSNREAVDEYWKTLEYCYAAAYPGAAKHAFPGSTVPEVFHHRSWTSVRSMSADQRAELLKLLMKDDLDKMLSYKECEKIAKNLNLTLQQVLRVYYHKHHQHLDRFRSVLNTNEEECVQQKGDHPFPSKKRKKSLESGPGKPGRIDGENVQLREQRRARFCNPVYQLLAEKDASSSGEHDHLQAHEELDYLETVEEPGKNEDDDSYSLISQYAFSKKKPARQSRFSWTDGADRQLLVQYVRHRAALGAKFHRIDWTALHELPAPPKICARRMASLKQNSKFRKALMKLCTMLSERYAKYLEKTQNRLISNNDSRVFVRCSSRKCVDFVGEASSEEEQWDDFNEKSIKKALEDILHYKRMSKLEVSKKVGSVPEEWSNLKTDVEDDNPVEPELVSSTTPNEDMQNLGLAKSSDTTRRSRNYRFQEKVINVMNEGTSVSRQVIKSLAVSNAVELLKLIFLSTSTAPEMQNRLAETLRRYSEHDLFAAFSYLREKKIMIGGSGGQPFLLSQQFFHNVSKSPFPANTGARAAKFFSWLYERQKDLVEGVILTADLQCGDIFELFALVSSGELSISPIMPDEGVGEAEDFRRLKRKAEDNELCDGDKAKKLKSLADSELVSRREKGFPGLMVSVSRATISTINTLELFKEGQSGGELLWDGTFNSTMGHETRCISSRCDHAEDIAPTEEWTVESPFEAMASYLEYLVPIPSASKQVNLNTPEVFRAVYHAIQKAGDQGLGMEEVSQVIGLSRENMHVHIIDVLQAFGQVLKVNAYASVRVVDALYHSKYFLTSLDDFRHNVKSHSMTKSIELSDDDASASQPENHSVVDATSSRGVIMSDHGMHKVTILNLPEELTTPNQAQKSIVQSNHLQESIVPLAQSETDNFSSSELNMPILPWMNGDGTINMAVYNGLVRRVVGVVMQNPGILEDGIIRRIDVLNPQSCRSLLALLTVDKHLIVRKKHQSTSSAPPALLGSLIGNGFKESKLVYREHFFANPMSTSVLL